MNEGMLYKVRWQSADEDVALCRVFRFLADACDFLDGLGEHFDFYEAWLERKETGEDWEVIDPQEMTEDGQIAESGKEAVRTC